MIHLMWFRTDLRVYDNPALYAACAHGARVVAVFLYADEQWQKHGIAPVKLNFLQRQLVSLAQDLARLGIPLRVLPVPTYASAAEQLLALALSEGAKHIYANQEYELNERIRDDQVEQLFKARNLGVIWSHDQCLLAPGSVLNGEAKFYQNFSAFRRKWLTVWKSEYSGLTPAPAIREADSALPGMIDFPFVINPNKHWEKLWAVGEAQAHLRLMHFIEKKLPGYATCRDFPGEPGSSVISPYLALGILSVRQCLQAARSVNMGQIEDGSPGVVSWVNELLWREFYRHLLIGFPRLCRYQPFKPETDRVPWLAGGSLFDAWCNGRTGFPLVDAGIRQLLRTGWMHNRVRMVVAMFLTKDLMIDWRLGEKFFMKHLVDGDFASNNGGWQWSASTGVDAAPYFRVFNPELQSRRFDPDGKYLRKFIPELSDLDNKSIHNPTVAQREVRGYPQAIVDHRAAAEMVKGYFKHVAMTS